MRRFRTIILPVQLRCNRRIERGFNTTNSTGHVHFRSNSDCIFDAKCAGQRNVIVRHFYCLIPWG